jgi:hypothetical protein
VLRRIARPGMDAATPRVMVEPELVVRESTASVGGKKR